MITITCSVINDDNANVIQTAPAPSETNVVRIWYFAKQIWDATTEDLDYDNVLDASVQFFPDHAVEAVVLLTSVDVLKDLMALKALEDEDAEVVQMITAQIQALEASINKEMEFLRPDIKAGSNDN